MSQIPAAESLTIEFKSDMKGLPNRDLVEAVVCLANTDGGSLYLGVEDDGTATGLHASHANVTGLGALIANRTSPAIAVTVSTLVISGVSVARIDIPKAAQLVATRDGVYKRRRLQHDGRPECVPFLPHEFAHRLSGLGVVDSSALPLTGATLADLDPAERARLRQFVERFHGDRALLELGDEELDGALGLTTRVDGVRVPTLAGLLLIGRDESLRRLVPTHELALQLLDGEEVRFNEFTRAPLLRAFEWLEASLGTVNVEKEIQVGMFRVPVPLIDRRALREAIANALTHRDYTLLNAVYIRLERDFLVVSSPGGFVDGVNLTNLLTTAPHPRNPKLADAFKRIGLVERTGRGVDLIFRGVLRFGRPAPDYARSTSQMVTLRIPTAEADLAFFRMVLDEEQRLAAPLPMDTLLALGALREHRRLTRAELAEHLHATDAVALATLEALVEHGLVTAHGNGRGRAYTLAPQVYAKQGRPADYTRQAGFDALQQEQLVRNFVQQHGAIDRTGTMELCRISVDQAKRLLRRMVEDGTLMKVGISRATRYLLRSGA